MTFLCHYKTYGYYEKQKKSDIKFLSASWENNPCDAYTHLVTDQQIHEF